MEVLYKQKLEDGLKKKMTEALGKVKDSGAPNISLATTQNVDGTQQQAKA